jgi:hypothetical protein
MSAAAKIHTDQGIEVLRRLRGRGQYRCSNRFKNALIITLRPGAREVGRKYRRAFLPLIMRGYVKSASDLQNTRPSVFDREGQTCGTMNAHRLEFSLV